MSYQQRPTVTGHTLNPLCLSRSAWAVSLVAMLLSSLLISISTFQSLSASTLERWTTFWSKVCLFPSSFHMQVSPPITLTLGTRGSQEYILRQSSYTPQTLPYILLKPMSRQVRSQLLRMTQFLRPTMRLTLALTPHQSITSSSCSGRSISSLAQQITFLLLEMFRHTFFCCWRQYTAREGQSGMLLAAIQSRMLCRCPQHSKVTSSPPKCTYSSSSKVAFTYFITSVTTSQVSGMVGSNWPMQSPLQLRVISAYFSLLPQDSVCAGESISGITRIPLSLAQSMTVLISAAVKRPPMLPCWLSSGTDGTSMGKASSSTMCQCSTFSLEQSIESTALRMVSSGRQCREVSIISPRHLKEGESCTEIGRPLTSQLPDGLRCSSCEKVSKALRNPGQKSALSYHFLSLPSSREQTSWLTSVGMSSAVLATAILSETWPASRRSLHLKTLVRYQSMICCISEWEGASMTQSMSQGLTGTVSPWGLEEKWRGLGQSTSAGLAAAMRVSTARSSRSCFIKEIIISPITAYKKDSTTSIPHSDSSTVRIYSYFLMESTRNIVITGGNAGIGFQTAKGLFADGHNIIIGSRNQQRNVQATQQIQRSSPSSKGSIRWFKLDLSKRQSVQRFAQEVSGCFEVIDVLINNAGMMMNSREVNEMNVEMTMAVNHFGHFLLTHLLLPRLLRAKQGRIINLSSEAHRHTSADPSEDIPGNDFGALSTYSKSKLANVLFTVGLADRLTKYPHVKTACLHPGIVDSDFASRVECCSFLGCFKVLCCCLYVDSARGATTSLFLTRLEFDKLRSGEYYDSDTRLGSKNELANDRRLVQKLWKTSEQLFGLQFSP